MTISLSDDMPIDEWMRLRNTLVKNFKSPEKIYDISFSETDSIVIHPHHTEALHHEPPFDRITFEYNLGARK